MRGESGKNPNDEGKCDCDCSLFFLATITRLDGMCPPGPGGQTIVAADEYKRGTHKHHQINYSVRKYFIYLQLSVDDRVKGS